MAIPASVLFKVTEPRRERGIFIVECLVQHIVPATFRESAGMLAGFLYWAYTVHEAEYAIVQPLVVGRHVRRPAIELRAGKGTHNGRNKGLLSDFAGLYRVTSGGTHYLTQHGLDGLPACFVENLYLDDDKPRFLLEPRDGGAFSMTWWDWQGHFSSGQNHQSLRLMAVNGTLLQGKQTEMFEEVAL